MGPFEYEPRTRVVFGAGTLSRLGELARELEFWRVLLVVDAGLAASAHAREARGRLEEAGLTVVGFHDFGPDPDAHMVARGANCARAEAVDSIVALGGGSSMDCAKGIAFVVAGGGTMEEYRGYGKARGRLPPMIGVPSTAGTGSEAQSYALISHPETHAKMACGDPQAAFRTVILDPTLTFSQPREVTATAGYDALSHAVETAVTKSRNALSEAFSLQAWRLLEPNLERVLASPDDLEARSAMQLGAWCAGSAIERSMLGAAHACANPLSARYGTAHGVAVSLTLPHVVRWNAVDVDPLYGLLMRAVARPGAGEALADRLEELARAAGLPRTLGAVGGREEDVDLLAEDAAGQWTGRYNPRSFDAAAARRLYRQVL